MEKKIVLSMPERVWNKIHKLAVEESNTSKRVILGDLLQICYHNTTKEDLIKGLDCMEKQNGRKFGT